MALRRCCWTQLQAFKHHWTRVGVGVIHSVDKNPKLPKQSKGQSLGTISVLRDLVAISFVCGDVMVRQVPVIWSFRCFGTYQYRNVHDDDIRRTTEQQRIGSKDRLQTCTSRKTFT